MDFAIYPFKRYGQYRLYVVLTDEQGKEVRRSTGVTYPANASKKTKREAREQATQKANEILLKYFKREAKKKTEPHMERLSTYLDAYYFPRVKANCKPSTLLSYRNALKYFMGVCGDKKMDEYKRFDFEKYKNHRLINENIAKTTINIELRSIKAAFNQAYKNELIERNPFIGQDYLFDAKPNRRAFSVAEIKKLLKATKGQMISLVIRLAYYTGMRIGEISCLTWEMVDLENRSIHLPAKITKTDTPRDIPLGDKAFNVINMYYILFKQRKRKFPEYYKDRSDEECYVLQKERGTGQYEVRSIQDMFRKAMNEAGLPKKLKFHCLRHSFATHVRAKGGYLGAVSKILGHTTTQVTQEFYDHTTALNYRETTNLI